MKEGLDDGWSASEDSDLDQPMTEEQKLLNNEFMYKLERRPDSVRGQGQNYKEEDLDDYVVENIPGLDSDGEEVDAMED